MAEKDGAILDADRYYALIGGIDQIIKMMEDPDTYRGVNFRAALKHARESAERYGREAE